MVIDIILGIIVLISMIIGFKNGIFNTLAHTVGWVIAIGCGIFFDKDAQALIRNNTSIYEFIKNSIEEKANETLADPVVNGDAVPDVFMDIRNNFISTVVENCAQQAADISFSIICFIAIVIAVRIVTFIFCALFSKKHNDGVIGFFDGVLGMLMGVIRGGLLVLLFLGLIFPLMTVISPEFAQIITDNLESSYVAGFLYDNNILMDLLNVFKEA